MNIVLCGLPLCGKTTVGKMLSLRTGRKFIDVDHLIEEAHAFSTGKAATCRQIFLDDGEESFRKIEREQIATLPQYQNCIIAVGGGSLLNPDNAKIVKSLGTVVYIKTANDVIWKRVEWLGIPALLDPKDPKGSFIAHVALRIPTYEKIADFTIDTENFNEDEIVDEVLKLTKQK